MAGMYFQAGPALNRSAWPHTHCGVRPFVSSTKLDGMTDSTGAALLGPVEIRALAEKLDIVPTKKLGQNFLHDPNTIRRIVAAAELEPTDRVLEVGPGLGSLTLGLVEAVGT